MLALVPLLLSNWKLFLYGGLIAGVVGYALYYRHELIVQGEQRALEQVKDANDAERDHAVAAAKNVDDCYTAGGVWDRDVGVCNHPAR